MIAPEEESRASAVARRVRVAVLACAVAFLAGCTQGVVASAIRERGGRLESLDREVSAHVREGIPGEWRWEMAYRYPEYFRWTLETYGEEQSVSFDGETAHFRLGNAALPGGASPGEVRSQARWLAITALDALEDSNVSWEEMSRGEVPAEYATGVRASYSDSPTATYELFFDQRGLLAAAAGPVSLEPIGSGRLEARYSDFRRVSGYLLPFAGDYRLNGRPLFEERILRYTPNNPRLTPDSFR